MVAPMACVQPLTILFAPFSTMFLNPFTAARVMGPTTVDRAVLRVVAMAAQTAAPASGMRPQMPSMMLVLVCEPAANRAVSFVPRGRQIFSLSMLKNLSRRSMRYLSTTAERERRERCAGEAGEAGEVGEVREVREGAEEAWERRESLDGHSMGGA